MKKVSLFWCLGNLEAISFFFFSSFPHILSAATFCLKATLSQEHSPRPSLFGLV